MEDGIQQVRQPGGQRGRDEPDDTAPPDSGLEERWDDVNPNGGGISLGHPLGATGARVTATLLSELERRGERYGVATMCIGFGQAIAAVLERL